MTPSTLQAPASEQAAAAGPSTAVATQDVASNLADTLRAEMTGLRSEMRRDCERLSREVAASEDRIAGLMREHRSEVSAELKLHLQEVERRFEDADRLELERVNGVHGRLDVTRAEIDERFQAADITEEARVNGVHGRVDVTRAEFGDMVVRLTEHVGESQSRMALLTAEVQRSSDLFNLKLTSLEALADQGLKLVADALDDISPDRASLPNG